MLACKAIQGLQYEECYFRNPHIVLPTSVHWNGLPLEVSCSSAAERSESDKDDAHALLTEDNNDGLPVLDDTRDNEDAADWNILECRRS